MAKVVKDPTTDTSVVDTKTTPSSGITFEEFLFSSIATGVASNPGVMRFGWDTVAQNSIDIYKACIAAWKKEQSNG